jgi:hypothetical protein
MISREIFDADVLPMIIIAEATPATTAMTFRSSLPMKAA